MYMLQTKPDTATRGTTLDGTKKFYLLLLRPWPVEGLGGLLGEGVKVDLREVGDAHVAVLAAARVGSAVRREGERVDRAEVPRDVAELLVVDMVKDDRLELQGGWEGG